MFFKRPLTADRVKLFQYQETAIFFKKYFELVSGDDKKKAEGTF